MVSDSSHEPGKSGGQSKWRAWRCGGVGCEYRVSGGGSNDESAATPHKHKQTDRYLEHDEHRDRHVLARVIVLGVHRVARVGARAPARRVLRCVERPATAPSLGGAAHVALALGADVVAARAPELEGPEGHTAGAGRGTPCFCFAPRPVALVGASAGSGLCCHRDVN